MIEKVYDTNSIIQILETEKIKKYQIEVNNKKNCNEFEKILNENYKTKENYGSIIVFYELLSFENRSKEDLLKIIYIFNHFSKKGISNLHIKGFDKEFLEQILELIKKSHLNEVIKMSLQIKQELKKIKKTNMKNLFYFFIDFFNMNCGTKEYQIDKKEIDKIEIRTIDEFNHRIEDILLKANEKFDLADKIKTITEEMIEIFIFFKMIPIVVENFNQNDDYLFKQLKEVAIQTFFMKNYMSNKTSRGNFSLEGKEKFKENDLLDMLLVIGFSTNYSEEIELITNDKRLNKKIKEVNEYIEKVEKIQIKQEFNVIKKLCIEGKNSKEIFEMYEEVFVKNNKMESL